MSLRERAAWDRHHPFSIVDYDERTSELLDDYERRRALGKMIAAASEDGEEIDEDVKQ